MISTLCGLFLLLSLYIVFTKNEKLQENTCFDQKTLGNMKHVVTDTGTFLPSPLQNVSFTWLAQHITIMAGNRPTHTKTLIQNIQLKEGIWISSTTKNSSNFNQWEPLGMQDRFSLNQTLNELGLGNFSHWKHLMREHRHFTFLLSPVASFNFFSACISTMEFLSWYPADEDSIGYFVHLELQNQNWNLLFLSMHESRTIQPLKRSKENAKRCPASRAWKFGEHNSVWHGDFQLIGKRTDPTEKMCQL